MGVNFTIWAKYRIISAMFISKLNELSQEKKGFFSDPLNFASLGLSLIINIIHWAVLYIKLGNLKGTILLHYNVVYGPDLVGGARFAYLFPLIALVFLVVNILLAIFFFRRERLAAYFLNFANIPIQLILLAVSVIVIFANV